MPYKKNFRNKTVFNKSKPTQSNILSNQNGNSRINNNARPNTFKNRLNKTKNNQLNIMNSVLEECEKYLGSGSLFDGIINHHQQKKMHEIINQVAFNDPYTKPKTSKLDFDLNALKVYELMNSKINSQTVKELKAYLNPFHIKFIKKYIINGDWNEGDKGDSVVLYRVDNESIILSVDTRKYSYKVIKKIN